MEPILDVLVGKTLEQSMMEVMEEEELAELRAHQEEFVQLRNAELAETQRLERPYWGMLWCWASMVVQVVL